MTHSRRSILFAAGALLAAPGAVARADDVTWPQSATAADIAEAREALLQWTEAYRTEDYQTQWGLTDAAIRRWWGLHRWIGGMRTARGRNGALLEYAVRGEQALAAESLPCTEQRHCYHPDIDYVAFLVETRYEIATPPQPEYAAMAWSEEGWRFGGGTLLNRPLGETAVIMNERDERRFTSSPTRVPRQRPAP